MKVYKETCGDLVKITIESEELRDIIELIDIMLTGYYTNKNRGVELKKDWEYVAWLISHKKEFFEIL